MVVNPEKFQVMFLGCKTEESLEIDGHTLESSDTVKLLGVTLDKKLNFNDHINDMYEG